MAKLEDLRELAKAIDRYTAKNIQIIGNTSNNTTILQRFYNSLLEDKFKYDDEYYQYLYDGPSDYKSYYKLKDRLEDRLINTLFFIDVETQKLAPIQKAYYQCYKNALAIKLLLGKAIRKTAITLAEKTLKKSLYFGFTDINLELSRTLAMHYGNIIGDNNKSEYYNKIIKKQSKILKHEIFLEEYHIRAHLFSANSNSANKKILKFINLNLINKIEKIEKKYISYKIFLYAIKIHLVYYEINNKWKEVIDVCNNSLVFLEKNPQYFSSTSKGYVLLQKLNALLIIQDFKEGEKIALQCLDLFPIGNINWQLAYGSLFRMKLHSRHFEQAKEILINANEQQNTNTKFQPYIESWKIHEAFINYLILIGKIDAGEGEEKLPPFRISKFLNEVPIYSKDKRGSNITILILQILFLLEQGKYDVLIDRAESLKNYTQRYLKDDETFRSNCFIKMLLCLPAAGFQKNKVVKKAKKYRDLLHSMPIEKAKQSAEIEVMPYEMLWEFALESLDRAAKK